MSKPDFTNQTLRRHINAPVVAQRAQRAEGETQWEPATIEGIASKVGVTYDLGWFKERIAPGAFDSVLGDDVRCLMNHNPSYVLARTASGTLELYLTDEGHLAYRYTTPNRSYARDLEDAILTGDVSQSSFAFVPSSYSWELEDGEDVLVHTKFERLLDVAPVTYPASEATEVQAKRTLEFIQKPERRLAQFELMQRRVKLLSLNK